MASSFLACTYLVPKPLFHLHAFCFSVSYVQICAKRLERKGSTQPLTRYRCKASNRTRRTVSLEVGTTAPELSVENKGERAESPLAPIIPCIISFSVIPSSWSHRLYYSVKKNMCIYSFIWDYWWRRRNKRVDVNSWLGVDPLELTQLELDEEEVYAWLVALWWDRSQLLLLVWHALSFQTEILNKSSPFDTKRLTAEGPRKENRWTIRTKRVGTNDREQGNSRSDSSRISKTSKKLWTSMDPSSLAILRDILHPLQKLIAPKHSLAPL